MSNDPWTIRRYRETDDAACRECVVELQEAERAIDGRLRPGEAMADEYLREMHRRSREYAGTILVAEVNGRVAGLTQVLARVPFEALDEPPGDYAIVAELVVLDGFRGRGLGAALVREAERHAREAGARELRINVLVENTTARQLYRREGFAPYLEIMTKILF
jgi:GNAT superfamily N-acetyltransferase